MKNKIVRIISTVVAIVVFLVLVKAFYFDSKMGFSTEILELNYSAFPMFIDVLICVIFLPLIVYAIVHDLTTKIVDKYNSKNNYVEKESLLNDKR